MYKTHKSLEDYMKDIRNRFNPVDDDTRENSAAVTEIRQWLQQKSEIISDAALHAIGNVEHNDADFCDAILAVDMSQKSVLIGCDGKGSPILHAEAVDRSDTDVARIEEIFSSWRGLTALGLFVARMEDFDYVVGKMTRSERSELFWCCLHGLKLLDGSEHQVYAACTNKRFPRRFVTGAFKKDWPPYAKTEAQ
ncbi:hypothetical protein PENSUB_1460 [Penicillium subrubescens]|uniref:Uncharacterized protein n=1 Tax=Penicillium subrubescens TaxID=1316194 RepID=A0A1Q5UB90_9EURO|nr:hypothetical protein PENSUB_4874 [Penicillium subrubescens]OKP12895.1 hypothetical protein PENSUB_1460 [Penicillium subrubescens]